MMDPPPLQVLTLINAIAAVNVFLKNVNSLATEDPRIIG
jgi:hypothetical protein